MVRRGAADRRQFVRPGFPEIAGIRSGRAGPVGCWSVAPRTQYVRARDGVSIAYQVVGEGERDIVFVPQTFSAVEALWEHPTVARFFARLGGLGRVILYDRRGTGMSDRTGGTATLEEQVDDVRAVMDAAGAERADLIAIMEGGPMAMLFAATAPERVRSLTLYAAFARSIRADDYPAAWTAEERAAAMREMVDEWGEGGFAARFAPSHADDASLRDWLGRLQRMALGPGEAAAAMELNGRLDVRHVLGTIRVPTLLLHRTARRRHQRRALALPRRAHPGRAAGRARRQRHAAVPRRLGGRRRRDRRVPDRRPPPARARPRARDRPVHRHRRLDRARGGARRRAVARPARRARPDRPRGASPATAGARSSRSATASSRSSTARRGRSARRARSSPT